MTSSEIKFLKEYANNIYPMEDYRYDLKGDLNRVETIFAKDCIKAEINKVNKIIDKAESKLAKIKSKYDDIIKYQGEIMSISSFIDRYDDYSC